MARPLRQSAGRLREVLLMNCTGVMRPGCPDCARMGVVCFVHDNCVLPHINLRESCQCINHSRREHGPSDPRMVHSDYAGACMMTPCGCKVFRPMATAERGGADVLGLDHPTECNSLAAPLCHRCHRNEWNSAGVMHECIPQWMQEESEREEYPSDF